MVRKLVIAFTMVFVISLTFVTNPNSYIHFDIYAWSDTNKPGLPKGGITQGPRAIFDALPKILDI